MESALLDSASDQFVGRWRRLVSTTNWEKGRIIHEWREALRANGTPASEYSDDAWSTRVGGVSPQHVGRLRRVFERFFAVHEDYPGLYWSHFQAAVDWDDAEMWLEGAVQNGWSVALLRGARGEALGIVAAENSQGEQESSEPWDDDASDDDASDAASALRGAKTETIHDPGQDRAADDGGPDDEDAGYDHSQFDAAAGDIPADQSAVSAAGAVRPFADLPPLPADVNDAFEAYKLCILRHKLAGWQEISRDDLLASLDSLKQLALAPANA
jgi:hypothetical protein